MDWVEGLVAFLFLGPAVQDGLRIPFDIHDLIDAGRSSGKNYPMTEK